MITTGLSICFNYPMLNNLGLIHLLFHCTSCSISSYKQTDLFQSFSCYCRVYKNIFLCWRGAWFCASIWNIIIIVWMKELAKPLKLDISLLYRKKERKDKYKLWCSTITIHTQYNYLCRILGDHGRRKAYAYVRHCCRQSCHWKHNMASRYISTIHT